MPFFQFLCTVGVWGHLTVVAELITVLFTLVGADDELQVVPVQEFLCDVGAPIAASAPHLVGYAAVLNHWVAPQQVQDLQAHRKWQQVQIFRSKLLALVFLDRIYINLWFCDRCQNCSWGLHFYMLAVIIICVSASQPSKNKPSKNEPGQNQRNNIESLDYEFLIHFGFNSHSLLK